MKYLLTVLLLLTFSTSFAGNKDAAIHVLGKRLVEGSYQGHDADGEYCTIDIELSEYLKNIIGRGSYPNPPTYQYDILVTVTTYEPVLIEAYYTAILTGRGEASESMIAEDTHARFYMFNPSGEKGFFSVLKTPEGNLFHVGLKGEEKLKCHIDGGFLWYLPR